MDVIYHRNCLDGAFSSYLLYLLSHSIQQSELENLILQLKNAKNAQMKIDDIQFSIQSNIEQEKIQLNEQSFSRSGKIPFNSLSFYAGDFLPFFPSQTQLKDKLLIIADITPSFQYLTPLLQQYGHVLIIDHHSSFHKLRDNISYYPEKLSEKLTYIWDERDCASKLIYSFINTVFCFEKRFEGNFMNDVKKMISYVNKNDLKKDEDKESKMFILGFYYLDIELSHQNPWLHKRFWQLNFDFLFDKGKSKPFLYADLYEKHLELIAYEIRYASIVKFQKGKYKGVTFLAADPNERGIVSDLGNVLSFLSVKLGYQNLAMLYSKKKQQTKISLRSNQFSEKNPLALEIGEYFEGGGHLCAAGCTVNTGTFKSTFSLTEIKKKIDISKQELEAIIFMKK